ncbi:MULTISPECIES: hypothetical protein [Nonomuraea]|uniref:Lipoprotein n=1 Tax=Nonomuraea mangrovi TaxID=2316207 RepID=A0ABW4TFQ2_9ACTN
MPPIRRAVAPLIAVLLLSGCGAATGAARPAGEPAAATPTPAPFLTPTPGTGRPLGKRPARDGSTVSPRPAKKARIPSPRPKATRTARPAHPALRIGVRPGSFCSPQGAFGRSEAGTLMRCTARGGDPARWRRG